MAPWEALTQPRLYREGITSVRYVRVQIYKAIHRCVAGRRFCESLAKLRVWLWPCNQQQEGRGLVKKEKRARMKVHAADLIFAQETFQPLGAQNTQQRRSVEIQRWGKTQQNKQKTTNNTNSSQGEAAAVRYEKLPTVYENPESESGSLLSFANSARC